MEEVRPGYVPHIPSVAKISTTMLNDMYNDVKMRVQNSMTVMLKSGYGTVIFDGWRDINGAPVVNVLVRVIGECRESVRPFFLGMIFRGTASCSAELYVDIVERIMDNYGGMGRIAAVVTDNTSSCRNARDILARKHGKFVSSQDQAHVADLLMKDIGEIGWIESTLATLSPIPGILRSFAKLNQRLMELMEEYNRSVIGDSRLNLYEYNEVVPSEDIISMDDPDQYEAYSEREERQRQARAQERAVLNTAIVIKPVSNVRFASSEKLLEEFIRLRPVLIQLIADDSFDNLYPVRDEAQRISRQKCFIDPIQDEAFLSKVHNLLTVFRSCRIYLRVFDGQSAIASDVYETTKTFRETLAALKESQFPEPSSENKKKLLEVVRNRCEGPLPGMKRVQVRLTSDLHITAYLMDPYRCPTETSCQEMMEALRRHMSTYLDGTDIDERKRPSLITEMVLRYLDVRNRWKDITLFQRERRRSSSNNFAENPIGWWLSGAVPSFNDEHKRFVMKLLVEFAVRTLSVSPSACAVESSFSLQGRMHGKDRSRLGQDKVRKLVFINWNARCFRSMENAPEDDRWFRLTSQAENYEKLVRERDNARPASDSMQNTFPVELSSSVHREATVASSQDRGRSQDLRQTSSAVVTNVMLIRTTSGRTFVAPQRVGVIEDRSPSYRYGRENQRQEDSTNRRNRGSRRRAAGRLRRRSGRRGRSYSGEYEGYVLPHEQYRELITLTPVSMEVDEAVDEDEPQLDAEDPGF